MGSPLINLKPATIADAAIIAQWLLEPGATDDFSWRYSTDLYGAQCFLQTACRDTRQRLFFIQKCNDHRLVGITVLYNIDSAMKEARTGCVITASKDRRMGYAKASRLLLLNMAFNEIKLERVYSIVHRRNIAAQRFLKHMGYIKTETSAGVIDHIEFMFSAAQAKSLLW